MTTTKTAPSLGTDRYELLARSRIGDFLEVWKARDRLAEAFATIKLVRPGADPTAVQRLRREMTMLAKLDHPGIVAVYDTGVAPDGSVYLVMELIEGRTLRQRLEEDGTPSLLESLSILRQLAEALQAAHDLAIAHRDLKPEDIVQMPDGRVQIVDFGMAARALRGLSASPATAKIPDTPQYVAPERARGEAPTTATDVYSLGVIAYELLSGRRPFDGEEIVGVLSAQVNDVPPALDDVHPALEAAVFAALAKNPECRPGARDWALALEGAARAATPS